MALGSRLKGFWYVWRYCAIHKLRVAQAHGGTGIPIGRKSDLAVLPCHIAVSYSIRCELTSWTSGFASSSYQEALEVCPDTPFSSESVIVWLVSAFTMLKKTQLFGRSFHKTTTSSIATMDWAKWPENKCPNNRLYSDPPSAYT